MVRHAQITQNNELIFYMQIKIKITKIASLRCLYNILKEKLEIELIFLHGDKHQTVLQVGLKTLSNKFFYKGILSLMMGMIKHSQSAQSNKLKIALQYLKY